MTILQALLAEIRHEAATTAKILERVPLDKIGWKPHEKSMELIRLASHVSELPGWVAHTLDKDELDFATMDYTPFIPESTAALLEHHEKSVKSAEAAIEKSKEEDLLKPWTLRSGEQIYFTLCKQEVLRDFCLNHLVHHRAQLGVYLRLLSVPLPQSYGPTADEH